MEKFALVTKIKHFKIDFEFYSENEKSAWPWVETFRDFSRLSDLKKFMNSMKNFMENMKYCG